MRVSEVSRALLEAYGGSLTCVSFHTGTHSVARLAALLRRQKQLKSIVVADSEVIPAFSFAIAQGCCRSVESISLDFLLPPPPAEHLEFLAGALEIGGALPALKSLSGKFNSNEVLVELARALSGGTSPLLENFSFPETFVDRECMDPLTDMLEARARNPGCQRLKTCRLHQDWRSLGPLESRIRLLRLLLPSVIRTQGFQWNAAFEPVFLESRPIFLDQLMIALVGDGSGPSAEVLEAIPALKSLLYICLVNMPSPLDAIPPVITALHRGVGLKNLKDLLFVECHDLLWLREASENVRIFCLQCRCRRSTHTGRLPPPEFISLS